MSDRLRTCLDCRWRVRERDLPAIDPDRAMIDHATETGHDVETVDLDLDNRPRPWDR